MSTNSNCLVVETEPNVWYYVLERSNAPKNAWDWLEHADATGPFGSSEDAETHLLRFNANPGGLERQAYGEPIRDTLKAVIAKARPARNNRPFYL